MAPNSAETPFNISTLYTYFQAEELYLSRVLETMIGNIIVSYTEFSDNYHIDTETIFIVFIMIQVVILLFMRSLMISRMRKEIFETRGIFNLLPN